MAASPTGILKAALAAWSTVSAIGVRDFLDADRRGAEDPDLVKQRPVGVGVVEVDLRPLGAAGRHRPRLQHVHGDPEVTRLDRQGLGQRLERPLAGRVRPDQREDQPALNARDEDELARALRPHARQHGLRDPQRAERVQLEDLPDRLERNCLERRADGRPGIAHEDVDASRAGDRGVDRRLVGYVEAEPERGRDVVKRE